MGWYHSCPALKEKALKKEKALLKKAKSRKTFNVCASVDADVEVTIRVSVKDMEKPLEELKKKFIRAALRRVKKSLKALDIGEVYPMTMTKGIPQKLENWIMKI